ncbi:hypothetical protein CK203_000119 [Vitis vinifera]|uniref:Uncharacterized protein n=1 Tax=Vitis vinifera TaxID=29760 RepID=A0A438KR10_VITVI|nr:hypothetical protein CK203_000119 [Vitis vinifera]
MKGGGQQQEACCPVQQLVLQDAGTWYFVAYGGHLHVVPLMELEVDMVRECKIFKTANKDGCKQGVLFVGVPFHMSLSSSRPIGHLRRVCNPSGIIPSRPR